MMYLFRRMGVLIETAGRFLRWAKKPAVQRWGISIATIIFIAGAYWSWQAVALDWHSVRIIYLLAMVGIAIPVIIVANILELYYASRLVGGTLGLAACMKVSILSSAANLLPLPAGPMMRGAAVADNSGSAKSGAVAVLYPALVWLAIGFVISAGAMVWVGAGIWALAFAGVGLILLVLCIGIVRRSKLQPSPARRIFVVKLVGVLFDAVAVLLALRLIGETATIAQAFGLAAAGPLGAAVSVVPSGLGIREAASSALGVIVGLSAAQAFLAPSVYRIVYMVVLAVLSPLMLWLMPAGTLEQGSKDT